MSGGKIKVYILAKDSYSKKKLKSKPKKFGLKKAYFLGHPNKGICAQTLTKYFLFTKY